MDLGYRKAFASDCIPHGCATLPSSRNINLYSLVKRKIHTDAMEGSFVNGCVGAWLVALTMPQPRVEGTRAWRGLTWYVTAGNLDMGHVHFMLKPAFAKYYTFTHCTNAHIVCYTWRLYWVQL